MIAERMSFDKLSKFPNGFTKEHQWDHNVKKTFFQGLGGKTLFTLTNFTLTNKISIINAHDQKF